MHSALNIGYGSGALLLCLGPPDLCWTGRTLRAGTACAGRMVSACNAASAAASSRNRAVSTTWIGTWAAKARAYDNSIPIRPVRAHSAVPRPVIIHRAKPPEPARAEPRRDGKINSDSGADSPRHLGGQIAQLRVPGPSQAADSFAGVPNTITFIAGGARRLGAFGWPVGSFSKALQNDGQNGFGGIMVLLKSGLRLAMLTLPLALGGCAGVLLVGGLAGVAGGGYATAQERGLGGALSDLQIETNVESAFAAIDPGLKDSVTTTVYQGRVLLTGTVPTPQMKLRAVEGASRVSGINALYDDIEVAPPRAAWDATSDAWITAQIRSELMLDPDIRSGNYTIDTQKGSVYLIGSARSQAELERATRSARYIPGVKRVVTYVELRPGVPVAQQPTPSIVPARSSAGSQSAQGS